MLAELSPSAAGAPAPPACRPLHVVINAGSGEHDAQETQAVLAGVFRAAGHPVEFMPLADPGALAGGGAPAAGPARAGGGILVAAGGDGTINMAAAAALRHGCALGVIPQGTFNYLARDHGIPLDAEAAARALVRARAQPVQVGLVNDRVFLVNASLGLYPQILQDREAFKARLGRHRWVAMVSGVATVFRWHRRLRLDIELEGVRTLLSTTTLFVGNNRLQVEQVGLEEDVVQRTGRGRLAGIVTRPVGAWTMLWLALRGALGRLGDADQVQTFSFDELRVRVLGARRVKIATDGEVVVMTPPLRFVAAAQRLQLMVPGPEDRVPRQ